MKIMLKVFALGLVALGSVGVVSDGLAQQTDNQTGTALSAENVELVSMFDSLRQKVNRDGEAASPEELLKLKQLYSGVNLSWIASSEEVMFGGDINENRHAVGEKVYIYTQKSICQSEVVNLYEDDDAAGDGGVASRIYTISLPKDSPCRSHSALVSYRPLASTVVNNLYVRQKMFAEEEKSVREKLKGKLPGLGKLELKLSKVANSGGAAFYVLECTIPQMLLNNRYKLVLRIIDGEPDILYVGSIGVVREDYKEAYWQVKGQDVDYYSGDGWSEEGITDVMTDLNENGLPEVVYSFKNCCMGESKVIELKTQISVKSISSYSS